MILKHFSLEPLREIHSSKNDKDVLSIICKPNGLWVSVEGAEYGWYDWCKENDFNLQKFNYETLIELTSTANVLMIDSPTGLDTFTEEYGEQYLSRMMIINWTRVASKYDGIIIAPYIWEKRLDINTMWYYGWDCASGCIWNADAIKAHKSIIFHR